jgi:hypothetical protein
VSFGGQSLVYTGHDTHSSYLLLQSQGLTMRDLEGVVRVAANSFSLLGVACIQEINNTGPSFIVIYFG